MKVLVIFETVEGQTGKIARFVADELADAGHEAVTVDLATHTEAVPVAGADRVILAAPVHERRHPEEFEMFLAARKTDLEARPTLFLSVSLNAAFPEGQDEAEDYVVETLMRTGFTPSAEMHVAGALKASVYDWFERQVVRHVVMKDHTVDVDGEREFTDWDAVRAKVLGFVGA